MLLGALSVSSMSAAEITPAVSAVNQFGLDLYRKIAGGLHEKGAANVDNGTKSDNVCLSPYSIELALAMAFAGSDGKTREEMEKVLHFTGETMDDSFSALRSALDDAVSKSVNQAAQSKQSGEPSEPITLEIANRLFGQNGYDFKAPFLNLLKDRYDAPFDPLDFTKDPEGATKIINDWIAQKTHGRIRDLIPHGGITTQARLVLTNAIYLKAPWSKPFPENATKPEPFHVGGGSASDLPTMVRRDRIGYVKKEGFSAVTLPYSGGDLQFLIILPNEVDGLHSVESGLTAAVLAECANPQPRELIIHLPKFKLAPPTFALGDALKALGMGSAFDQPPGSATFDRIAPRKPNDHLAISNVYHKTFISVDEKGTEAAAATAVAMATMSMMQKPVEPLLFKVDHPFLFAIQHRQSGACLFLGRITDPG